MTPEQIKARCKEFGETWDFTREQLNDLESLCREMLAAGLEQAAHSAKTFAFLLGNDRWKDRNVLTDHAAACRQEAQQVKEGVL